MGRKRPFLFFVCFFDISRKEIAMVTARKVTQLTALMTAEGWGERDIDKLLVRETLRAVYQVLAGQSEIVLAENIINCATEPLCPLPKIRDVLPATEQSRRFPNGIRGLWKWEPRKVLLFRARSRKDDKGYCLPEKFAKKKVLGAHALDFLLARLHLIPKRWKGRRVLFLGTIYSSVYGDLFVRCLFWDGEKWASGYQLLNSNWSNKDYAAVAA